MRFLKTTFNGYIATRSTRFSGVFDLDFDEASSIRNKVTHYATSLVFTGLLLNIGMLFVFPIEGLSFYLRPALYTSVVMVGVLIYAIRTKNVQSALFLTLFTALALLSASLALGANPRHTLWVLLLVFLAFLVEGAKKGFVWLMATSAIIAGLSCLSNIGVLFASFDPKVLAALFMIAVTTSIAFLIHDITLQQYFHLFRESNKRLAEESARRYAAIDAIADGVITADADGRITYVNNKATQLLGIQTLDKIEEAVGTPLVDCVQLLDQAGEPVKPEDRPEAYVLQSGQHINTENTAESYQIKPLDGHSFPIETAISPVRAGIHNYGIIQLFRDVSWQHEINSAKNEFVSLASHQLRTPLASIKWNCEMLRWPENYDTMSDDQKSLFEQIQQSAAGMSELVGALLDVSRMELGTLEFKQESIDIADSARRACEAAQAQLADKQDVHMTTDIIDAPQNITADKRFVQMILDNLISNAIKYTPKGTVHVTLQPVDPTTLDDERIDRDGVLISVEDSGYGIPEKQQSQIFSKMFRADNVRTTNVGGTGLGLYLVHSTIKKMNGTVWFESTEDVGTTFFVYFPAGHTPAPAHKAN